MNGNLNSEEKQDKPGIFPEEPKSLRESGFHQIFFDYFTPDRLQATLNKVEALEPERRGGLRDISEELQGRVDTAPIWEKLRAVAFFVELTLELNKLSRTLDEFFSEPKKPHLPKTDEWIDIDKASWQTQHALCALLKNMKVSYEYGMFKAWLEGIKEVWGTKPYRGEAISRAPIFTWLIKYLGDMLSPRYKKPHKDVVMSKKCAEIIAKLLNGYFEELGLNFSYQAVHRRYKERCL